MWVCVGKCACVCGCVGVSAELTITFWKCLDIVSRQTPECSDIHIFDRT